MWFLIQYHTKHIWCNWREILWLLPLHRFLGSGMLCAIFMAYLLLTKIHFFSAFFLSFRYPISERLGGHPFSECKKTNLVVFQVAPSAASNAFILCLESSGWISAVLSPLSLRENLGGDFLCESSPKTSLKNHFTSHVHSRTWLQRKSELTGSHS